MSGAGPGTQAGPEAPGLAPYCRALPDLQHRLRAAGLRVGPDRWQNLHDLLLALAAQGRLPSGAAALEPLFAPLLVASDTEQRQFQSLFADWLAALTPAERGGQPAAVEPEPEAREGSPVPGPRLRWPLLALLLVSVALVGGLYWYHWDEQPPAPDDREDTGPLPPAPPLPALPAEPLALEPIPPRRPMPEPMLGPSRAAWHQTLGTLCLVLPPVIALAWLLVRWLSWRTVLERRQGRPEDPLAAIGLPAREDDLLAAPSLREALRRLHNPVAVPTRRLDARATVTSTARQAGLFRPVTRMRRRVPELVVLVESAHAGDQMAGLAGQLVERLREAGLSLHRYEYRGSPRLAVAEDGRWWALDAILERHRGARLLLIGEPGGLVDGATGGVRPWVLGLADAASGPRRSLLTTRRPPRPWQEALTAAGFAVAEIGSQGLHSLALHLSGVGQPEPAAIAGATAPLPRLLQDAPRWSRPTPPRQDDQAALLATLDAYLGADGAYLLAALAAYPELHWGLTRVLDRVLFPPRPGGEGSGAHRPAAGGRDGRDRERRLLQIARLPWSRRGRMPDWLRTALIERLEPAPERRIRRGYREILRQATTEGRSRIALPVSLPQPVGLLAGLRDGLVHRSWRLGRWLRVLRALSRPHGVLHDAIFADLLFARRLRLLDFVVPKRLFARHLRHGLQRAMLPRAVLALGLALGGAWLGDQAWEAWLTTPARDRLMAWQNAAHQGYSVQIYHRPGLDDLAETLREVLAADRFEVEIAVTDLALPEGKAPDSGWINKIQWGVAGDVETAEHVRQRLRYLTWGQDPEVTNELVLWSVLPGLDAPPEPGTLRVLLATPGRTGSAFRDALDGELTAEQIEALTRPPADPEPGSGPELETEPPAASGAGEDPGAADRSPDGADEKLDLADGSSPGEESPTADGALPSPDTLAALSSSGERPGAAPAEQGVTPTTPGADMAGSGVELDGVPSEDTELALGLSPSERGRIQTWLKALGFDPGPVDGVLGPMTRQAITAWQEATGLATSGYLDAAQLERLREEAESAPPRQTARVFRDPLKDGGEGPEMVRLPGGTFVMGSPADEPERASDEGPQRQVSIQPFALGRTEVTFADYDRFAEATGRKKPNDQGWGRGARPVINVSWEDAKAYAAWLAEQTGQAYRLPTEAEWEYAARAGTTTPFWTGECIHTDQANYDGNYDYDDCGADTGVSRGQTVPAGSLPQNPFGLYEIAGNAWEWVEDCWHEGYQGAPSDGSAWLEVNGGDCALRVLRGGSWGSFPWILRSADRDGGPAGEAFYGFGFRLARTF